MKSIKKFKTITEISNSLKLPQHVLRFWESKFKQLKPLKLSGNRRYYRDSDVELIIYIKSLLYDDCISFGIPPVNIICSPNKSVSVSSLNVDLNTPNLVSPMPLL